MTMVDGRRRSYDNHLGDFVYLDNAIGISSGNAIGIWGIDWQFKQYVGSWYPAAVIIHHRKILHKAVGGSRYIIILLVERLGVQAKFFTDLWRTTKNIVLKKIFYIYFFYFFL